MVRKKGNIAEKILECLINIKMLNTIKITLIGFILLLSYISLSSAVASAATYCVATTGNDSSNGTCADYPWRTIQHAANMVGAGDTVYVKSGIYMEQVIITKSGSPGKYITFAAFQDDNVTIDGTDISLGTWGGLIRIFGSSYINIIGFNVAHSTFAGIMVTSNYSGGYPSNILIQNNFVTDTNSSGIYTEDGNNITYDGNEVTHAQTLKVISQQNEIVDMVRTNNFEIKNNKIYDNDNFESIDVKEGSSYGSIHHNSIVPIQSAGIYIDSQGKNAQNIDIYNNRIHDGASSGNRGIALATEKGGFLKKVNVYNNIINNNAAIGIAIASYSTGPIDNVTISSNTVYNNGLVDNWGGGIVIEYKKAKNVIIVNNIAYNDTGRGDLVTDNRENSARFTNLVGINPIFVNAGNQDFHLQSSSPAIDNGSSPSPTLFVPAFDFDNVPRPQDAGYDIGAFEYKPDFSLSASPASQTVVRGANTSYDMTITGFTGEVTFSVTGLPSGASGTFSPNPATDESSTLSIVTKSNTPTGSYPLIITGISSSLSHTTSVTLNVTKRRP